MMLGKATDEIATTVSLSPVSPTSFPEAQTKLCRRLYGVDYMTELYQHLVQREVMLSAQDGRTLAFVRSLRTIGINMLVKYHPRMSSPTSQLFFLAVYIFDSFMIRIVNAEKFEYHDIHDSLNTVVLVCLRLATKYEDTRGEGSSKATAFLKRARVSKSMCAPDALTKMELYVLSVLDFCSLSVSTMSPFLCRYLIASKSSTYNQSLSMFICELALTSIELMMFPSSVLAATAVFITRLTIHRLHQRDLLTDEELLMLWNPELQSASGLKIADMFRCVTTYKDYYAGLQRYVNLAAAFKVVEKYTKDFYGVAKIRLSFE